MPAITGSGVTIPNLRVNRSTKVGMKPAISAKIRVLIADDHVTVLEGLVAIISRPADMAVLAAASDGAEVVTLWKTAPSRHYTC